MNRIFILTSCLIFALLTSAHAGELYTCIDRDGNSIITNSPQDGMKGCVLKDTYKDPTPNESRRLESESDCLEKRADRPHNTNKNARRGNAMIVPGNQRKRPGTDEPTN
jgi:hypothetical protein